MTRIYHVPDELAGILSSADVEQAREAATGFGGRDTKRFETARDTFEDGS